MTRILARLAQVVLAASAAGGMVGCASAAPPPNTLLVLVTITGAVDRSGGYQHAADQTHGCRPALEVPPAPVPGSTFANLPFAVEFDPAARPPGTSFRLEIPGPPAFRIAMTAAGRFWTGDSTAPGSAMQAAPDKLSGTFRIRGLHAEGTMDTIDVEGSWTCPQRP